MLIPANVDINVYRTGTFTTKILIWKSLEPLEQFPLHEYTVELIAESLQALTVSQGLVVVENEITVELTPQQTTEVSPGTRLHYYIKLTKGSEIVFPMRGTMSFISP